MVIGNVSTRAVSFKGWTPTSRAPGCQLVSLYSNVIHRCLACNLVLKHISRHFKKVFEVRILTATRIRQAWTYMLYDRSHSLSHHITVSVCSCLFLILRTNGCVSKPIIINVSGVNTHTSQLFWCEQKGYKVLTQSQICSMCSMCSIHGYMNQPLVVGALEHFCFPIYWE